MVEGARGEPAHVLRAPTGSARVSGADTSIAPPMSRCHRGRATRASPDTPREAAVSGDCMGLQMRLWGLPVFRLMPRIIVRFIWSKGALGCSSGARRFALKFGGGGMTFPS